ncbi:trypsin epsilon-like [Battus philenor]|uniref:trypsin epsilon-like n=1 Tax=Battus philenor TaxID=42288 RepID=UPI0035CEE11A
MSRFPDEPESKIIGGEPISIESLPSAVQFFNFGSLCSGTIINSWSILTAAHCFDQNKDVYDMVIQVGARYTYDNDAEIHRVLEFIIHSNYSKEMPFACDIALVFYGGPISDSGLLKTYLEFIPKEKCEKMHNLKFTSDMFCLYGDGVRDTCKGDSGGGVIWNDTVVGIVSHGAGCSNKNKPSIYSNVWYFRNWIKKEISKFFKNFCSQYNRLINME